jgi:hypothetical protein
MYPLLLLFSQVALLSFTAYTYGRQRPTVWLAILVACAALAPYSHYFGVLVGAGVLILSLCFLLIERDRRQLAVIRALVIAGVLASPVIFLASRQLQLYADKAATQELVFTPMGWQSLPALFSGSLTFELQTSGWMQALSLLAVAGGFWALWVDKKKALAVGLAGLPAVAWLVAGFLSLQNVNIAPRYVMHVAFLPLLLAALSLARSPDRRRTLPLTLAVAAIVLYSLVGMRSTLNREYLAPDWRKVAQILEQEARRREPVVVMGWDAIPIEYYSDKTIFTSYDFVDQLPRDRYKSYLIVNSEHARILDFLDFTQSVIYEDPQEKIKIIRYFP